MRWTSMLLKDCSTFMHVLTWTTYPLVVGCTIDVMHASFAEAHTCHNAILAADPGVLCLSC